ncbi:MAG: VOC family protein [Bryobacteraceae bacterium]|jgi:methylmalonyl-CoA/ethylmalonyl-CoA epimerase
MPDLELHHVGFVVASIEPAMEGFLRSLNASWDQAIFEDPLQKVKVAFLTRPGEPQIELVEPVGASSPVRKFLEKGGGLHHFCYQTPDLESELKNFRSRGAILVRHARPAVAFDGRRIAWVLTRERLLVELLESVPPQNRHA